MRWAAWIWSSLENYLSIKYSLSLPSTWTSQNVRSRLYGGCFHPKLCLADLIDAKDKEDQQRWAHQEWCSGWKTLFSAIADWASHRSWEYPLVVLVPLSVTKRASFAISLEFLQSYSAEDNDFLYCIITGDGDLLHPRSVDEMEIYNYEIEIHIIACNNKIRSSIING